MTATASEIQERHDQLDRDGFILILNALPMERVEQWKTVLYALYDRGAYEISKGVGNVAFEKLLALEPELAGELVGHESVAPYLHAIMGQTVPVAQSTRPRQPCGLHAGMAHGFLRLLLSGAKIRGAES